MSNLIFIFAGEKSGDLLGGQLMHALLQQLPDIHFCGVGGEKMRAQGMECLLQLEAFETMGLTDVLFSLPKIWRQFSYIRQQILQFKPKAVVLIDYPGFNLRMAKSLRKNGYQGKIVQYVCPTIWAWGKKRKVQMEKTLDLLLTIYPFEKDLFSKSSLNTVYVGNPLQEGIRYYQYDDHWFKLFGILDCQQLIALFPGSRRMEIQQNLPYQIAVAEKLKRDHPSLVFGISCAHEEIMPAIQQAISRTKLTFNHDIFLLPRDYTYELMRSCRAAIGKSGSVTLELALHQIPTVVMYKISRLNRWMAKHILRVKITRFCIVNILAEKEIFPEMIAKDLTVDQLYHCLKKLLEDEDARLQCIRDCQKLSQRMGESRASEEAAAAIATLITKDAS